MAWVTLRQNIDESHQEGIHGIAAIYIHFEPGQPVPGRGISTGEPGIFAPNDLNEVVGKDTHCVPGFPQANNRIPRLSGIVQVATGTLERWCSFDNLESGWLTPS